jgi:hypothetical protein
VKTLCVLCGKKRKKMEVEKEIEIRSKKVRSIIGQVPPYLIRAGFTIAFVVLALLITALYFFEYEHVIDTSATIIPKSDSTVFIKVNIPVNQIEKITADQLIVISFENIPNMSGQSIQLITKEDMSPTMNIMPSGAFYTMDYIVENPILCHNQSFYIRDSLTLDAEIHTGKVRLFSKILNFITK